VTPEQHHYVFVESAIGSAIINAVLNGAIGWGITRGLSEVPVWKAPGAAVDLVFTAFGVAFGTCLGAFLQVRLDLKRGKITAPLLTGGLSVWIARSPRATFARAVAFGAIATVVFGPLALGGLLATGATALGRVPFVVLKAGFSAVVGAVATPFILLATLASAPQQNPQAS
jgi:hypothetical protein